MFTDHMLFSGATELFWVLVTLYSFAMSIRVPSLNLILLHPTPGPWAFPNTYFSFSRCAVAVRILRAVSDLAYVAGKNSGLFPAGRQASTNWKEETSC